MAWFNSKNFQEFTDTEEQEEEEKENEDYNIDQIVNRLQSKLDSASQKSQNLPNKFNTNPSFINKNITPPQKLIRTLMSNQIQINNNKNIIINNPKINSSNNSYINKTTENDEGDINSVISGNSMSKNGVKRNSNTISVNVNLPSEIKNEVGNKKDLQFIIKNLKSTPHNTDSIIMNSMNSQIDNSKFILNKYSDINEILQSKKFQEKNQENKESKDIFKEKINEMVNDKNKVDENLCKKGKTKKFRNIFINKNRNRFYKCIVVNCYCNYNLRNICKCCRNFNTITFIRNIFIFTVIVSAVSFYTFLIFFN